MIDQAQPDRLCINTIRTLSIDAIQRAHSGHPGTPMGAAPTDRASSSSPITVAAP